MPSENKSENQTRSNIVIPLVTAVAVGSGAAVSMAFASWAWFHQNNLSTNTVTVLAGGAVTGAAAGIIASLISCCMPAANDNVTLQFRIAGIAGASYAALFVAAFLTAPLMGEMMLNNGTKTSELILTESAGAGVIIAGFIVILAVVEAIRYALKLMGCRPLFSESPSQQILKTLLSAAFSTSFGSKTFRASLEGELNFPGGNERKSKGSCFCNLFKSAEQKTPASATVLLISL